MFMQAAWKHGLSKATSYPVPYAITSLFPTVYNKK